MFKPGKALLVIAMFALGLAARTFAPESAIREAEAAKMFEVVCVAKDTEDKGKKEACVTSEEIWKMAYDKLVKENAMSGRTMAALAMAEVRSRDLDLMSNSTDRIVNYHGRRFAITEDDYEVLLRIVEAEAGGEDIIGKMLVANVVLNRLEIGFGGDTITDVVFYKGQFTPAMTGKIFRVTVSEETIEAVERVMDGEDHSEGAIYFMARKLASKKGIRWFDKNLKFLFKHGCHEFFIEK